MMKTLCLLLLSVSTGLTWKQQGPQCQYSTSVNMEEILWRSLLPIDTTGYPQADHKITFPQSGPILGSIHHLNNEPGLNTGAQGSGVNQITSSEDIALKSKFMTEEKNPVQRCFPRIIHSQSVIGLATLENTDRELPNNIISLEITSALKVNVSSTTFDHQSIVVLEDDPVVMESASFLFNMHPSVSTLMMYHKGALQVFRGSQTHLTKNSHVVLVGHGSKGSDGVSRLGGFGPDKLAEVVVAMERKDEHLSSLSLAGCSLGKDLQFAEKLLRALRSLNVETKLHLSTSELSISPNGEMLTRDEGLWRQKDTSKKVIAQLDQNGNLVTRVEGDDRGRVILHYQGQSLQKPPPEKPAIFVDNNVLKKYPDLVCLNAIAWACFSNEQDGFQTVQYIPERRTLCCVKNNQSNKGRKSDEKKNTEVDPSEGKCSTKHQPAPVHIRNIHNLIYEIRKHAYTKEDSYFVLNHVLYFVDKKDYYVYFLGKYLVNGEDQNDYQRRVNYLRGPKSYHDMMNNLKKNDYSTFFYNIYDNDGQHIEQLGLYFLAAVFSESVRNFRTFSLFLISNINDNFNKFVEGHPMTTGGTWCNKPETGFYGCSIPTDGATSSSHRNSDRNLLEVAGNESELFNKMSGHTITFRMIVDLFGADTGFPDICIREYNKYIAEMKKQHVHVECPDVEQI